MSEADSSIHMFEKAQFVPSDDGSISVAGGSTWGGGGTINWSASLQTQGYVRKEWADRGLKFSLRVPSFKTALIMCAEEWACLQTTWCTIMETEYSSEARRLGYRASAVPQNTKQ